MMSSRSPTAAQGSRVGETAPRGGLSMVTRSMTAGEVNPNGQKNNLMNVLKKMPAGTLKKPKMASNYIKRKGFPTLSNAQLKTATNFLATKHIIYQRDGLTKFRGNFGR